MPRLNLVVLRVEDIDRAAAFYSLLDFAFVKHAHGSGPEHYACNAAGFIFELYPASPAQPVSTSTRIGFAVDDVDHYASKLSTFVGCRIVTSTQDTEWGRRAVITDPDGHQVELSGPPHPPQ